MAARGALIGITRPWPKCCALACICVQADSLYSTPVAVGCNRAYEYWAWRLPPLAAAREQAEIDKPGGAFHWTGQDSYSCPFFAIAVIGACANSAAWAWGNQGHEIVGIIAADNVSSSAHEQVARILGPPRMKSLLKRRWPPCQYALTPTSGRKTGQPPPGTTLTSVCKTGGLIYRLDAAAEPALRRKSTST